MTRPRLFALLLALAVLGAHVPPVRAGSIDDASSQLVVPLVIHTTRQDTRLFIQNHESTDAEVILRYVGALGSGTPGVQICQPGGNNVTVLANSILELDLKDTATSGCTLNGGDHGMVVLVAKDNASIARLSARARIDLEDPAFPTRGQTFMIDGIPLAYLDTTDNVHVAGPLSFDPAAAIPVTTDCFLGTFFPANTLNTSTDAWLEVKDKDGKALGSPFHVSLKPLEFAMLTDVFGLVGAPPMNEARVEFSFLGAGNNVLGFCRTRADGGTGPTFAYQIAQVAEPRDETRRRRAGASATPGAGPFVMSGRECRSLHGLYVRHPDIVTCTVSSVLPLDITAVSPDGGFTFGGPGGGPRTPEFGMPLGSYQGASGIWGIEIAWPPWIACTPGVGSGNMTTYTINCTSGNGTSLIDDLTN